MNNTTIINDYLVNLGNALNIKLKLEENGICAIQIEKDLPMIIEVPQNSEKFYLYAPLMQVSGEEIDILDTFGKALILNMFQIKTGGGSLALSDKLQEIVYCLNAPIEGCNAAVFCQTITDFILNARKLKSELEESGEFINE